jgi:hypothetical protein
MPELLGMQYQKLKKSENQNLSCILLYIVILKFPIGPKVV